MKLRIGIGTAIATVGIAGCGSTMTTTPSPSVVGTVSPTFAATVSPSLEPTDAPTPTAVPTATPTPTPTATPGGTTLGPSGLLVAELNCDGVWTASVKLTGFAADSTTNYIVSVTNNLDTDGTDANPYTGVSFGNDPDVDVNAMPTGEDEVWGASGRGNVVGDFLMLTISPATGGNAGGAGYYGETTTVTAPAC